MTRTLLHAFRFGFAVWIGGIDQQSDSARFGQTLAQQFEALCREHGLQGGDPCQVAARLVEAGYQTELDRVHPNKENDGNRGGGRLGRNGRGVPPIAAITAT